VDGLLETLGTYRFLFILTPYLSEYFAYLSQACKSDFIRLGFGPEKDVSVISSNAVDRKHATMLFVPLNPKTIRLMQSLVEKIVIVDGGK
jgi:hypothetical protein